MEVTFVKNPQEGQPVIEVSSTTTAKPVPETLPAPATPPAPVTPPVPPTAPVAATQAAPATSVAVLMPMPAVPAVPAVTEAGAVAGRTKLLGDVLPNFSDLILPRVNLVQNIGGLKDSFEPGTLVYNQATPLFIPGRINEKSRTVERAATAPVSLVFMGLTPPRFVEKIEGGGKGIMVFSEKEVTAAGGTTNWNEWDLKKGFGMKRFEPFVDALVFIERPEIVPDDDTIFVYNVDGKKYALAWWGMRGTTHTQMCKRTLYPARLTGVLRQDGYASWVFKVASTEVDYKNGHISWVPTAIPFIKTSPALFEYIKSILEGTPEPAPAAQA